jgi:hypothetical protein
MLRDWSACRKSWWIDWSHAEQRLAVSEHSTNLAKNHPDIVPQLMLRLSAWTPQP